MNGDMLSSWLGFLACAYHPIHLQTVSVINMDSFSTDCKNDTETRLTSSSLAPHRGNPAAQPSLMSRMTLDDETRHRRHKKTIEFLLKSRASAVTGG